MATPYGSVYLTWITAGPTLIARSRAIDCFDWSALLGDAAVEGELDTIVGQPGRGYADLINGPGRYNLPHRINGEFDEDNNHLGGTTIQRIERFHAHLEILRAVTKRREQIQLRLTRPWTATKTADCVIRGASPPSHLGTLLPWAATVVVDVEVMGGAFMEVAV